MDGAHHFEHRPATAFLSLNRLTNRNTTQVSHGSMAHGSAWHNLQQGCLSVGGSVKNVDDVAATCRLITHAKSNNYNESVMRSSIGFELLRVYLR